jgi:DnaJ-class molecular chaperone
MAAEDGDAAAEEVDFLVEKDLYKILGVPKGAKPDDIKKAYRKLSLKHHPDKNQGDPDAKAKFQKIAEAFSILSDSQKRLKYDKSGDMDLEDFDMDQFMNMWVGEMMEDGGVVDDMMKEVLPWADDEDKMRQFVEENVKTKGKKLVCKLCGKEVSNKRLMLAHFEQKHKWECEDWANETVKSMKASFESFMKQITGIGDNSGTFVLPDGTTAEMSKVKGVPDIRQHMQSRVDKAKDIQRDLHIRRRSARTVAS